MKSIFFIISSAVLLAACTTDETKESNLAAEYFPLQIGNRWEYAYPKNGTWDVVTTYTIDSTMEIDGKMFYVVEITHKTFFDAREYRRYRTEGDILWEGLRVNGAYQVIKRADFTLTADRTYRMPIYYEWDTANYVVSVLEKSDTKVRYLYEVPGMFDEEEFIGFEKGRGIVFYSREYQYGLELVRADLKP
ncbi:MAG: hypothetical protein HUU02_09115 [Bacteroidetes bacterium]|nr:hypothetical protein [Bacteroidota bacterium]